METEPITPRPTPEEAAAALREAESAQESTRAVKVPAWYYPTLGLIVAPVGLLQVIPRDGGWFAAYVIGGLAFIAAITLMARIAVRQMGVQRWLTYREMWPVMVGALLPILGGLGLYLAYDTPWAWVAMTVGLGALFALFGPFHRRTSPHYRGGGSR